MHCLSQDFDTKFKSNSNLEAWCTAASKFPFTKIKEPEHVPGYMTNFTLAICVSIHAQGHYYTGTGLGF